MIKFRRITIDLLTPFGGIIMQRLLVFAAYILLVVGHLFAGDTPDSRDEATKLKSEYADVFALRALQKVRS